MHVIWEKGGGRGGDLLTNLVELCKLGSFMTKEKRSGRLSFYPFFYERIHIQPNKLCVDGKHLFFLQLKVYLCTGFVCTVHNIHGREGVQ
jgi:hypothetical protein